MTHMARKLFALVLVPGLIAGSAAQQKAQFTPAQAKALADWTYSLAIQAATWGSPAVIMYTLRYNDAVGPKVKAAPNSLWRIQDVATPAIAEQEGYVLPNCSVLYGFGFLDLRQEPVIMTMPDSGGIYYMIETVSMW